VVRVGDYGGYIIVETHNPDIHSLFLVRLCGDVPDAVAVERKAIEYRKKNVS
jgi:hypothetical protein